MSTTSETKKGLKNGILGSYSGSILPVVVQKNNVIKIKALKGKRRKGGK